MKIADLKQPYRRMAEYLAEKNTNKDVLVDPFGWHFTSFWIDIDGGKHPPITEEIKKNFPPDFDFSGEEEIKNKPVMQMLDLETQKFIYTQLAKEGKFDELPDTCEFSEPVELEVSDYNEVIVKKANVVGKFKSKFVEKEDVLTVSYIIWNYAQLPTPKIDYSEFENGDIVEIVTINNEKIYGLLFTQNFGEISLTFSYQSDKAKVIFKEDIKLITKIK